MAITIVVSNSSNNNSNDDSSNKLPKYSNAEYSFLNSKSSPCSSIDIDNDDNKDKKHRIP